MLKNDDIDLIRAEIKGSIIEEITKEFKDELDHFHRNSAHGPETLAKHVVEKVLWELSRAPERRQRTSRSDSQLSIDTYEVPTPDMDIESTLYKALRKIVQSEQFLDSIVDRIKRKQL